MVAVAWPASALRLVPAAPAAGDQADGEETGPEKDQRSAAARSGSSQVRGSTPGGLGCKFGLGGLRVLEMHLRLGGVVGGKRLDLGMRTRGDLLLRLADRLCVTFDLGGDIGGIERRA